MASCVKPAKYLLIAINSLFMVAALIYIGVGIWLLTLKKEDGIIQLALNIMAAVALVGGILSFLLAFFGFWGALKENICLLATYAWILVVVLILDIIAIIYNLTTTKSDEPEIDEKLHTSIRFDIVGYVGIPIEIVCIALAFYFSHCIKNTSRIVRV